MENTTQLYDLFEHQPDGCREPLALDPEKLSHMPEYLKRVLLFVPTEVYERIRYKINPFNRYNFLPFVELFPIEGLNGKCACGCGRAGNPIWHETGCQFMAIGVWNVIGYRPEFLSELYKARFGHHLCEKCGTRAIKEWDHICPVSSGGGGSWLPNHQGLCKKCHTEKTRDDFGWTKLKTSKEYE